MSDDVDVTLTLEPMAPGLEERFFAALVASGMREAQCEGAGCSCAGRRFFTREEPRAPELCPPCRAAAGKGPPP
jgi:hypothetical protein